MIIDQQMFLSLEFQPESSSFTMNRSDYYPNSSIFTQPPNSTNKSYMVSDGTKAFAIMVALICVGTIAYNLLIVVAFLRDPSVRNPFSYYLLNVSICDLGLATFSMSGFVWFTLNPSAQATFCPYYNFLDKIFSTGTCHTVVLISLDRLYSLFFPIRYRNTRSTMVTGIACAVMWVYLLLLLIPYLIMDSVWYKKVDLPCTINYGAQHSYSLLIELLAYDVPPVFVLCSSVIIFLKLNAWRTRRSVKGVSSKVGSAGIFPAITNPLSLITSLAAEPGSLQSETADNNPSRRQDEYKQHLLFALLSLCILICFVPGIIFYLFVDFSGYWSDTVFAVVASLQYLSCVFNPLIYHSSLPTLQKAIKRVLRCQ